MPKKKKQKGSQRRYSGDEYEMATSSSGAVFFLGTRAHYQVLQQPEARFDVENGNTSTETICENGSVTSLWRKSETDDSGNYTGTATEERHKEKIDIGSGVKRRIKRRQSETALCDRDSDMKPALLNNVGDNDTPKVKSRARNTLLRLAWTLARRRIRPRERALQHLQHLHLQCSYRESCRCLDCQSRYFDCDEEEYSSEDSDYEYTRYVTQVLESQRRDERDEEDDEVFLDPVPSDNTSTDLLIEAQPQKMSVSSDEVTEDDPEGGHDIEVAAGTPVLLNYLLTHPITCAIQ